PGVRTTGAARRSSSGLPGVKKSKAAQIGAGPLVSSLPAPASDKKKWISGTPCRVTGWPEQLRYRRTISIRPTEGMAGKGGIIEIASPLGSQGGGPALRPQQRLVPASRWQATISAGNERAGNSMTRFDHRRESRSASYRRGEGRSQDWRAG